MISILYKTFCPWICMLLCCAALFLFLGFRVKTELKDFKREMPQWAKNKIESSRKSSKVTFGILAVLSLAMILYNSLDIVLRDFVTCDVTYIESDNGDFDNLTRVYTFDANGETLRIHSLREKGCKNYLLEKGEKYTVTYSKRTQMIVDVDGVEKVSGVEQPLKVEKFLSMIILSLFGIVGCAFGVWRLKYVEEKSFLPWK